MLAGCAGGDSDTSSGAPADAPAPVTVTVTAGDEAEAPDADEAATEGDTQEINGRTALLREVGQPGKDGAVIFRVTKLGPVASLPVEYSDPVTPASGARLIRAEVVITNDGKVKVDPFCGQTGAILVDQEGRNFEFDSNTVSISGNSICEGVQPGFRSTETLAFQVPKDARVSSLALWDNSEEGDYEGRTYVRVSR
ncbi:MAG: hypothetical protein AB7I08_08690 [Thermoleophilia bacterium]